MKRLFQHIIELIHRIFRERENGVTGVSSTSDTTAETPVTEGTGGAGTDPEPMDHPPIVGGGVLGKPKRKSRKKYFLSAGHGGGHGKTKEYVTPGKRWEHPWGWFYEGIWNREVLYLLTAMLDKAGIDYEVISHPWKDTRISERVKIANDWHKKHKNAVAFDIHANAFPPKATEVQGIEVFTYFGFSDSDIYADMLLRNLQRLFPQSVFRFDTTDGDLDKEANLGFVRETICPAVLGEFGFFTHPEEAKRMMTLAYKTKVAQALFDTISQIEEME